ncbi:DUF2637 domain-containing protein [Streptosporangium sp. NBC_01495]|uniref:hypothetical protein n=1 Tax=Streptosporangium sp. NBC_01495 TaxID=2903899 RepID=UPI002E36C130|nr:hypothetical protein [Streptosporangium sp. NBC_01495]
MDVKSPGAAGSISRPSPPPPLTIAATEPSRVAVALRRAGIAVTGVGVAALTAAACVLSFEDLRALAIAGRAPAGLAYLYPAAFDALLVIAMIGVLLLRGGWWPVRLQAGVVLTLLFAGAATAEVSTAMRMTVDEGRAAVVVAVAPWVMLVLALWLWLLLIKHAAARRSATDAALSGPSSERDIVPFPEASLAATERPGAPDPGEQWQGQAPPAHPEPARSGHGDHSGHPGQLVHHPAAEIMLDPHAAPPLEAVPHHDLPVGEPVIGPTAAPETPEVNDIPQDPPPPRGPATPRPGKPMRWGDLVRPRQGDLLVHPPRPAVRAPREEPDPESGSGGGRVSERVETWDSDADLPRERTAEAGKAGKADESGTTGEGPRTTARRGTARSTAKARNTREAGSAAAGGGDVDEVSERDADTQPILAVKDRPASAPPGTAKERTARKSTERAARTTKGTNPETTAETAVEAPVAARGTRTAGRKAGGSPDPAHGAEAAETGEEATARSYDDEDGTAAPPSGRMRSTPVPPGE